MSQQKTYYEILGVPRQATPEQIQLRYRQWARKYHPDVAADKANAQNVFAQINAIYEVLHDPKRRAEYDRSLPPAPGADPQHSPLESPGMEHLLSEAEGDALAEAGQYAQALVFYRLARGRKPNPFLEAKIPRTEAKLAGHSGDAADAPPPPTEDPSGGGGFGGNDQAIILGMVYAIGQLRGNLSCSILTLAPFPEFTYSERQPEPHSWIFQTPKSARAAARSCRCT